MGSNSSDHDSGLDPVLVPDRLIQPLDLRECRITVSSLHVELKEIPRESVVKRPQIQNVVESPWHYGRPYYGNPLKLEIPSGRTKFMMVGRFRRHAFVNLTEYTPGSDWNSRRTIGSLQNPYQMVMRTLKPEKYYYLEALYFVTDNGSLGWFFDRWRIHDDGPDASMYEVGYQDTGGASGAYDQLELRVTIGA